MQSKLDKFTQQVEQLTKQVAHDASRHRHARTRLGGGFERNSEYHDLRASLDKLVADKPKLESKLRDAEYTLADAKAWLDQLPDDAVSKWSRAYRRTASTLITCAIASKTPRMRSNGCARCRCRAPISESGSKRTLAALARPKISGIAAGQQLKVSWPDDVISVLALLLPDQMTDALLKEIDRLANLPMPLPQRKRRIAELTAEIDTLRWQARALGDTALPPAYLLGVRVARREPAKRVSAA